MTSLSFEPIAHEYDQSRGGERHGRFVATQLAPELHHGKPVLEVGIGTGLVAAGLAELGFTVVGFDISPGMVGRAHRRLGARVGIADAHRLPIADESVEQIVVVWLLQLVADQRVVLTETHRALRSGGRCVIVPGTWSAADPADPIGCTFDEIAERLDLIGRKDDRHHRLAELAEPLGYTVTSVASLPPEIKRITPRQGAKMLRTRIPCILWALDDATFDERVLPLIERLERRPDADVLVDRVMRREKVVLTKD